MRVRVSLMALAAAFLLAPLSLLAESTIAEKNLADQLFRDAIKLMEDGKLDVACPKFAESYRLDPVGGTQFNLAMCHELAGRYATALALFNEVAVRSKKEGRVERLQKCKDHIAAIEPKVSRVSVAPSKEADVPGLEVALDGVVLARAAWQTEVPVDPGPHKVTATAPGKRGWETTITIGAVADKQTVSVPALRDLPVSPLAGAKDRPVAVETSSGTRMVGLVVTGIGIVSVGTSAFLALRAQSLRSDAEALHASGDVTAFDRNDQANRASLFAKITLGVGVVAAGAGLYLIVRSPTESKGVATVRVWASAAPNGGLFGLGGAW
jgi:hypothetical protein